MVVVYFLRDGKAINKFYTKVNFMPLLLNKEEFIELKFLLLVSHLLENEMYT